MQPLAPVQSVHQWQWSFSYSIFVDFLLFEVILTNVVNVTSQFSFFIKKKHSYSYGNCCFVIRIGWWNKNNPVAAKLVLLHFVWVTIHCRCHFHQQIFREIREKTWYCGKSGKVCEKSGRKSYHHQGVKKLDKHILWMVPYGIWREAWL